MIKKLVERFYEDTDNKVVYTTAGLLIKTNIKHQVVQYDLWLRKPGLSFSLYEAIGGFGIIITDDIGESLTFSKAIICNSNSRNITPFRNSLTLHISKHCPYMMFKDEVLKVRDGTICLTYQEMYDYNVEFS